MDIDPNLIRQGTARLIVVSRALHITVPEALMVRSAAVELRAYFGLPDMNDADLACEIQRHETERVIAYLYGTCHGDSLEEAREILLLALKALSMGLVGPSVVPG